MKKIIYSLVIMIAAGSLFTSCIEQVEPLGIQDMRFAKAEYIRALKDLRAADAELVRAEAAHELARARYVDAMTANLNADTEYQKLLNEYQQLLNEARQDTNDFISQETANKIDSIKKLMAERELTHQKNMVANQDSLANAQERLRVALRNIALASQSLTEKEKNALENATKAYEIAFEKVAKQTVKVFEAQQKVHEAEIALAKADKVEDEDTYQYVDALEYYNRKLEEAQVTSALSGLALLAIGYNFTDTADLSGIIIPEDLSEWKSEIEALEDSIAVLDYSKAAIITEIANYYVANIHDGVEAFNDAVTAFKAENWWEDGTVQPELTDAEADTLSWGEPKQDQFKMGFADTIKMPALVDKGTTTYTRFYNLIAGYEGPFAAATSGYPTLEPLKKGAKFELFVDQSMKDFVLGTDQSTYNSQSYYVEDKDGNVIYDVKSVGYGLKGALSVLERKNVTAEQTIASYADSATKYYQAWKVDRDSLAAVNANYPTWKKTVGTDAAKKKTANGGVAYKSDFGYLYGKYAPYTTAVDGLKTAIDNKATAQETLDGQWQDLLDAIKKVYDEINKVSGDQETVSINDSTAIIGAIADYAAKREAYLPTDKTKYPKYGNPNFFYFSITKELGEDKVDSVAFKDLATQTDFPHVAYEYQKTVNAKRDMSAAGSSADTSRRRALANILEQCFGFNGNAFNQAASSIINLNIDAVLNNATPLRKGADADYAFTVDSWKDPKKLYDNTSTEYKKEASNTAVAAAEGKVDAAIGKYENDLYCRFWGAASYPGVTDELNPKGYNDTTFTTPFPIVNFDNTNAIIDTKGLTYAVEAYMSEYGTYPETLIALFGEGGTTFGVANNSEFMKWMYYLDMITVVDTKDLEDLQKWVAAVEHAFALDAEEAGMPNVEAYEEAKAAYDRVNAKAEKVKAYLAKKKEFTGEDKDGNPNEFVEITTSDYDQFNEFFTKDEVTFELVPKDPIYDVYTGKWIKALGGKQLEIANTLFPKLPENMKEWQDNLDSINDRKEHVATLQTAYGKAYKSAAKAKYGVDGSTLDDVIANVQREVVNDFAVVIEDYFDALDDIKSYTEDIRDYDQKVHVEKVHPAELALAKAQRDLAIATERLNGYQKVLDYAKANLDKILEYIKSLDVNFVVVTNQDIENNK